ncbi:MAG: hypothetical protein IJP95_00350, partial [Bacteroidales bacterium]|nr:hypothetical protein [Bacteroidales bacterium]
MNIATLVALFAFAATATAQVYDETYYSPSKNSQKNNSSNYTGVQQQTVAAADTAKEEYVSVELAGEAPVQANATPKRVVTTVVYSDDDYYDYAYTARLRRFYSPVVGAGYFDDYYTNMYWYTYDPVHWGVSIYLGYNWWYPTWYYRPYYYGGYGVAWGWGYDPYYDWYWYRPHYYRYHHWYPHHHHHYAHHYRPYHHYMGGYHHRHVAWNSHHYYNSYDRGSFYYGNRNYGSARYIGSGRSTNRTMSRITVPSGSARNFGMKYEAQNRNSSARYTSNLARTGSNTFSASRSTNTSARGNASTSRRYGVDLNTRGTSNSSRYTNTNTRSSATSASRNTGTTNSRGQSSANTNT